MQSQSGEAAGYSAAEIGRFAKTLTGWSKNQDVFAFFISGAKERNPAAALALQEKLGITPGASAEADAMAAGKAAKKPAAAKAVAKSTAKAGPVKKAVAKKAPAKKK
jgi:hypothetical protein